MEFIVTDKWTCI